MHNILLYYDIILLLIYIRHVIAVGFESRNRAKFLNSPALNYRIFHYLKLLCIFGLDFLTKKYLYFNDAF